MNVCRNSSSTSVCGFTAFWIPRFAEISRSWQSNKTHQVPLQPAESLAANTVSLSWVLFCWSPGEWGNQHRSVKPHGSVYGNGSKHREKRYGLSVPWYLKERGRAGNWNARSGDSMNWNIFAGLLYISCTYKGLWGFPQFLLCGFLTQAGAVPQISSIPLLCAACLSLSPLGKLGEWHLEQVNKWLLL